MSPANIRPDLARLPEEHAWSWVDDGLLPYLLALLRSLWIWLLLHLLFVSLLPGQDDLLGFGAVFGLLAAGTLAAQVFVFRSTTPRRAAVVGGLFGLAMVLLALYLGPGRAIAPLWQLRWLSVIRDRPAATLMTAMPAAALLFWGVLAGRERVYHETLLRNFALGLAAILAIMLVAYSAEFVPTGLVIWVLTAFVAVGLVALAVASLQETRLLLGQIFAPGTLELLADLLAGILRAVGWLLSWAVFIISYPIFKLLEWLIQRIDLPETDAEMLQIQPPADLTDQFKELAEESVAGPGSQFPWWILVALVVGMVMLAVFVLAFRRFRSYAEDGEVEETRESVLSLDLLRAQLAGWLRGRGGRAAAEPEPYAQIAGDDPRIRVRRTYQALLAWAAGRGLARQPGLTPEDYVRVLADVYPACRAEFAQITAAYYEARYSPLPVAAARAEGVEAAWQQAQTALTTER
ncbi:MAG: hypothetical protein BWY52_00347 [Chloroflexi bacterium ADurb.Bin325]|nr:MAG: hypothetical protein BWY52_00347 [Chloroflexi bacterium ADurb.Bin325]